MDEVYLQKIKHGEPNAFSYFVRTYKEAAFGIAFSVLKNSHDAEDVVQEAFIKIYKNIAAFNASSKFSTWLYRIVVNEAYKKIKSDKKHLYSDISSTEINFADLQTHALEKEELKHFVTISIEALSPDYALALQLFYIKEHSIDEICEITAWSFSKVKVTLHRARNQFYNEIQKLLKSEVKNLHYSHN